MMTYLLSSDCDSIQYNELLLVKFTRKFLAILGNTSNLIFNYI